MPDGSQWPSISIVTPSYNQGEFIEETIRSVLLQGYPNLEYIIMDGGSTDNSVAIIQKYAPWLTHWVSQPDDGQSHAINKGFDRANGEIIGWLNSDDYFQPNGLHDVAQLVYEYNDAVAWAGTAMHVDRYGGPVRRAVSFGGRPSELADFGVKSYVCQPACLFRSQAFSEVGGLAPELHIGMDADLWCRLAKQGNIVTIDTSPLANARIYREIKTLQDPVLRFAEQIYSCIKNGEQEVAKRRLLRFAREFTDQKLGFKPPTTTSRICFAKLLKSVGVRAVQGARRRLLTPFPVGRRNTSRSTIELTGPKRTSDAN